MAAQSTYSGDLQVRGSSVLNPIIVEKDHQESSTVQGPASLYSLLTLHQSKVIDQTAEHMLHIDRSTPDKLWQGVLGFYKSAMLKPYKLHQELVVQFISTGEVGADSGALKREFFEDALVEANNRFFEGDENRRIIKKDYGLEFMCEIGGMLVAHSIMQEGPAFACLSQCMFQYISNDDCYPELEDIPLNVTTHVLITYIEKVKEIVIVSLYIHCFCTYISGYNISYSTGYRCNNISIYRVSYRFKGALYRSCTAPMKLP